MLSVALVLGALYVAAYVVGGDRVPRDVSVADVDIGGLSPDQAADKLRRELAPRAQRPIVVQHGSKNSSIVPSEAGLTLDVSQTVSAAGGVRSLNPLRMIERFTGGTDVEPVVNVDEPSLDKAVGGLAGKIDQAPVEGVIRFANGQPDPAYPNSGRRLDTGASSDALRDRFLDRDRTIKLPVRQVQTELSDRDVNQALDRFARPAMSAPVAVEVPGRAVTLNPATFGDALSMRPRDGKLVPRLNWHTLDQRAGERLSRLTQRPRPATVVLRNGSPQVVPRRVGTDLNTKWLAREIPEVLTRSGKDRTVTARIRPVKPAFATGDARRLRIEEVVSEFTTYFPHSDYRNTNLGRAAKLINGTVLRPDDTFSLNEVVGERTAENGFTEGYVIDDGVLVEDFGGGVSQVATTVYNAAFFAGLKDIEHHPHSLYFDRYPVGREATVAWGALDLKFQNNTPYGALIEAWIEPSTPSTTGEMHARIWSTTYWDVKAGRSDRYNRTEPDVRYDTSKNCVEQTGFGGFDVDVYRDLYRDGERVKSETDNVTYDAADTIYCRRAPR